MDRYLDDFLKSSRVFSSLDEHTSKRLLAKFNRIELKQGETLFYQGDPSDSIFLLVSGKLSAELTTAAGETRVVGHIGPGETVGEGGALTGDMRSLTVKALKDATLLRLPAKDFVEICHHYPAIMFATIHPIITRSKSIIQMLSAEKTNKHILLIPANSDFSIDKFVEKLSNLAEHFPSILIVSDFHADFSDKNAEHNVIKEKIAKLSHSKKPSHRILYILSSHDTPLAKLAFKKADMVYVVGHSRTTPKIDRHILDKIESRRLHFKSDPELVILHPENSAAPQNTAAWLAITHFGLHHHIRLDVSKDFQRLLRFMRGKATGIVFSGGGTRGWSHLGAIKALQEAKIPIDMLGGVSGGAIVAGCYAMSTNFEEAYENFYKIVVGSAHSVSWQSLTWPTISVFNGKSFTESLMKIFANQMIEDLWLPYFCLSTNLANGNEAVHRHGILWEKIRASAAIPGLIPPMLLDGEIHLDGGLLNNLPVDVMRQFVGSKGRIIAVELNSFAPDYHMYDFPPILTFTDLLLNKLGFIGKKSYHFPRFVDTFLRGLFVGSTLKAKQNSMAANIFISLDTRKFRLLQSNPKQADRLIEIGYQDTIKQIQQAKSKELSQTIGEQLKEE